MKDGMGAGALLDRRYSSLPSLLALRQFSEARSRNVPQPLGPLRPDDGAAGGTANDRDRDGDRLRIAGITRATARLFRSRLRGSAYACLAIFEVAIFAGANGGIFRLSGRRNAVDDGVVIGVLEEGDRQPLGRGSDVARRVYHAVHVRDPAIVGPAHQQVADIDDEIRRVGLDVDPGAVARQDLQPAGCVLAVENGEGAVVGVLAGTQLTGLRRRHLRRIEVETHGGDMPVDFALEESLV